MAASDPVSRITPEGRVETDPTPGIVREQAIAVEGLWAGLARTAPGMSSGWHHHGEYQTSIYVVSGRLRMESGPGGGAVVEAVAGDFVHVPAGAIHRESNPSDAESHIVVVRAGQGVPTVKRGRSRLTADLVHRFGSAPIHLRPVWVDVPLGPPGITAPKRRAVSPHQRMSRRRPGRTGPLLQGAYTAAPLRPVSSVARAV